MTRVLFRRPAPDRRAAELEQRVATDQPASPNGTRPVQDPTSSQSRSRLGLHNGGFVVFGRIVDAVAYARTYKVQCERGIGTLRCCDSAATGLGAYGARQLNTYPVGTGVLVFYHPQAAYHAILCAVPDWAADATAGISDLLVQGGNCGAQVDAVHRFPFQMPRGGGIIDFSAGRPGDSLSGEWGAITELGLRVLLDPFQVQVAVDEETGLFLCYFDQYARLAGRNLDVRSAVGLREDRDDEGELVSWEGFAQYPWEAAGMPAPGEPARELSAEEAQQGEPWRSRLEPKDDLQLGIHREQYFRGYLGQGGRRVLLAPNPDGDQPHTYDSDETSLRALAEEFWALDGLVGTRSAKGIYLVKSPLLPAAKRARRPEDHTGDRGEDAYAPAGHYGVGPEHKVRSGPLNEQDDPHVLEPAAALDLIAHAFNWQGLHPFYYHSLDWYLAEESALPAAEAFVPVPFGDLSENTFLPQAAIVEQAVDDRYGLAEYYANLSFWALLPNGGIAQVDGWGSEIRSAGGTQYINTPGDLVLTAGRRIILQAGQDVILKGQHGVEVSASKGHVRVGASGNVLIAGGLSGCGGVLVESRAEGVVFERAESTDSEDVVGGVILRSRHSAVLAEAAKIQLTTAAWEDSDDGHIIIDAGTLARVVMRADTFVRHVETCALDAFPDGTANEFWVTRTCVAGTLDVRGGIFAIGDVAVAGQVAVGLTVSATSVHRLSTEQQVRLDEAQALIEDRPEELSTILDDSAELVTWMFDNGKPDELEFYYRSSATLGTEGYTICEPAWAQLARAGSGGVPGTWEETRVVGEHHEDSAPYPGLAAWFDETAYGQIELNLFDPAGMHAVDRGEAYETPELAEPAWVTLEGNWPVIPPPE